jgi:putative addiction module component (TIGR02574 family)
MNHDDRAKLLEAVSASLDGESLGDEWEDIIARRVADLESAKVVAVPGEQVFQKLEQRFGGE